MTFARDPRLREAGVLRLPQQRNGVAGLSPVAPVSWLIQHDVSEARAVLNFSEWQWAQKEAKEARDEILEQEMPPAIYQFMHAHARLSDADRDRLAPGLANTLGRPAGAAASDVA